MLWLALLLIGCSLILTLLLQRKVKTSGPSTQSCRIESVSPLIGLSAILVGITLMVGFIVVSQLGRLGQYLADALRVWIS